MPTDSMNNNPSGKSQKEQIAQLRSLANAVIEEEGVERLMFLINTKDNGAMIAQQALSIAMRKASAMRRKITSAELRTILAQITSQGRREGSITIHHK